MKIMWERRSNEFLPHYTNACEDNWHYKFNEKLMFKAWCSSV